MCVCVCARVSKLNAFQTKPSFQNFQVDFSHASVVCFVLQVSFLQLFLEKSANFSEPRANFAMNNLCFYKSLLRLNKPKSEFESLNVEILAWSRFSSFTFL